MGVEGVGLMTSSCFAIVNANLSLKIIRKNTGGTVMRRRDDTKREEIM